ncbi:uncharacterized protein LOC122848508 isoform X2 [Aphidius gifuensis]|uniref:uncharacterized protein LOC122848508 isoform X2 n=1 Tax=Aphidius gifuensis TaxID=684658 RepID=UPI001CDC2E88|nr:uncharacterized protein LOC122848508 isoform X2 [Aphidius gifuensis]
MFTKRKYGEFIEICAFISLVSLTMTGVSLLTQDWINGSASVVDSTNDVQDSTINYGLWGGTLIRKITLSPREYNIYITCLYSENKCAWSCRDSSETRIMEIENLINGQKPLFDCQPILSTKNIKLSTIKTTSDTNTGQFLNAGIYLSSLIFIITSFILYFICFILAIVNCVICPTQWYLNTRGIVYLTIGALIVHAIALILFGFFYDFWIVENIGIFDTIVGFLCLPVCFIL